MSIVVHSTRHAGCSGGLPDWSGIDYKGYDVVDAVIAKNKAKYVKPNVQFFSANV